MPPIPPHSDPNMQPSGQPGLDAYTSGLADGKVYTHLHSDPVLGANPMFGNESGAAEQAHNKAKATGKVYVYRLAGADEVRAAKPAVTALLQQALALNLSDAGKNSLAQGLTVSIGEDGSLSARNELLLASAEVAIGTNTYVPTPEKARAIAERFIAAVQGLMGQIQAGAKQVRGVSGPLPDVMKGKLEYLNAEQVNAKGMDCAHHWRVSFRQTLPVAPDGSAYAPVSAGQCVVLVGGIPGSRSGGVLGMESSLVAVRETVESDRLQYGSAQSANNEPVDYASTGSATKAAQRHSPSTKPKPLARSMSIGWRGPMRCGRQKPAVTALLPQAG